MTLIHPTAVIASGAQIAPGVEIGAYAVIGPQVVLAAGNVVGPHAVIEGATVIGPGNRFLQFCAIGAGPQVDGWAGETGALLIGSDNVFREFVTVHASTGAEPTRRGFQTSFRCLGRPGLSEFRRKHAKATSMDRWQAWFRGWPASLGLAKKASGWWTSCRDLVSG